MPEPLSDSSKQSGPGSTGAVKPLGMLFWIAGYKLVKAVIAILGALLLLHIGHQNLIGVAHRWLADVGLDPEGPFGAMVITHVGHIDAGRVQAITLVFWGYAILYCVEAYGLIREKRWAEWLTIVQTMILVPVEVRSIFERPHPWKFVALFLSLGVVAYLIWRIRRDGEEHLSGRAG